MASGAIGRNRNINDDDAQKVIDENQARVRVIRANRRMRKDHLKGQVKRRPLTKTDEDATMAEANEGDQSLHGPITGADPETQLIIDAANSVAEKKSDLSKAHDEVMTWWNPDSDFPHTLIDANDELIKAMNDSNKQGYQWPLFPREMFRAYIQLTRVVTAEASGMAKDSPIVTERLKEAAIVLAVVAEEVIKTFTTMRILWTNVVPPKEVTNLISACSILEQVNEDGRALELRSLAYQAIVVMEQQKMLEDFIAMMNDPTQTTENAAAQLKTWDEKITKYRVDWCRQGQEISQNEVMGKNLLAHFQSVKDGIVQLPEVKEILYQDWIKDWYEVVKPNAPARDIVPPTDDVPGKEDERVPPPPTDETPPALQAHKSRLADIINKSVLSLGTLKQRGMLVGYRKFQQGARVFVNAGTQDKPLFRIFSAPGLIGDVMNELPLIETPEPREGWTMTLGNPIQCVRVPGIKKPVAATYILMHVTFWKGREKKDGQGWWPYSTVVKIKKSKVGGDKILSVAIFLTKELENYHRQCSSHSLHPKTNKLLSAKEKEDMPWLAEVGLHRPTWLDV